MSGAKPEFMTALSADLDQIESALQRNLTPYTDISKAVAGHLLFSGGKRLRPLMVVLAGRMCGCDAPFIYDLSVVVEYLHAATLLHDDIVDGARLRRGATAAHQIWNPAAVVLTGDFLLARALSIAAASNCLDIIRVIADLTEKMSQGEICQLEQKGNVNLSEAQYSTVITHKTAALIRGACQMGAYLAQAPEARQQALAAYGLNLGIAFQIADDLLDYTADTATIGKAVGADLREGKLTLPLIHALAQATPVDGEFIKNLLLAPAVSKNEFDRLLNKLNKYGSLAYTRNRAAHHVNKAIHALQPFDPSPTRDIMTQIAHYTLKRNK